MHVPSTALWTAKAQMQLGLLVEARDTIAAMRRMPEQPNDPKPFKDARAEAIKLDDQLAPRVAALTIVLKGAPPGDGASMTIDDVQVPATAVGLPRSVDAGHHVVAIKSPTAQGQAEVDVKEGEQKQLEVNLDAIAAPPPPPTTTDQPPPQTEEPPAPVRSHAPTALTWIGIGLAGAGAIAGGITGVMSMQKTSTIKNDCANNTCGQSDYATLDSANTLALVSDIGFGVAGAGAILAVVTLLVGHDEAPAASAPAEETPAPATAPPDQPQSRLHVVPWLGLGTAGLTGTF
ncbi:MAG TPA: hypothetical protein VF765_35700, partial [Polyangiaceae bacterium]